MRFISVLTSLRPAVKPARRSTRANIVGHRRTDARGATRRCGAPTPDRPRTPHVARSTPSSDRCEAASPGAQWTRFAFYRLCRLLSGPSLPRAPDKGSLSKMRWTIRNVSLCHIEKDWQYAPLLRRSVGYRRTYLATTNLRRQKGRNPLCGRPA